MLSYKVGDILEADEQFIVHQCNCRSKKYSGLAYSIFTTWPYANTYTDVALWREPGSIHVFHPYKRQRGIINLYSQVYPGKHDDRDSIDSEHARIKYFFEGLLKIAELEPESLAFPYFIGCGLAQGDWNKYEGMLQLFAERIVPDVKVTMYELPT